MEGIAAQSTPTEGEAVDQKNQQINTSPAARIQFSRTTDPFRLFANGIGSVDI